MTATLPIPLRHRPSHQDLLSLTLVAPLQPPWPLRPLPPHACVHACMRACIPAAASPLPCKPSPAQPALQPYAGWTRAFAKHTHTPRTRPPHTTCHWAHTCGHKGNAPPLLVLQPKGLCCPPGNSHPPPRRLQSAQRHAPLTFTDPPPRGPSPKNRSPSAPPRPCKRPCPSIASPQACPGLEEAFSEAPPAAPCLPSPLRPRALRCAALPAIPAKPPL